MKLEKLPKETLVELARMYAQNWQTLDGLWFRNVEAEYGLEATGKLDLKNWERQSTLLSNIAKVVEPRETVKCLLCPPDPHPDKFWCKWELTMNERI